MKACFVLLFFVNVLALSAEIPDSIAGRLARFAYAAEQFGNLLPQEKVYLQFDNTSYYQGDRIWFSAFVITSEKNCPTSLSKTLYVELLNPGGELVDKRILPVREGRCHGEFALTQTPFYSGFYEIRAYTKYMLNFGDATIFSRIFPIFEKPKEEGNFAEKTLQPYAVYKHPQERKRSKRAKRFNLRFYPEGGHWVNGLPTWVAFEATDAFGNPVDISGHIENKEKNVRLTFETLHEGRGVFLYTPTEERHRAVVEWNDKTYRFNLPEPESQGFAFAVNNLASADSLEIEVRKNRETPPATLGVAVMARGQLYNFCMLTVSRQAPVRFKVSQRELPVGVAQVVLFDESGRTLADRLLFVGRPDTLALAVHRNKELYQPFDSIQLDFQVTDTAGQPVQASLSVSVRDGWEEVESRHSLLTDLLLMSEIKGYVRRPTWYFEADDSLRRHALDQLLMVQGWRRYAWKTWAAVEPFELKYMPEQGIELHGTVVSMVRSKPRPHVQVASFLMKRGKEEEENVQNATAIDSYTTDSLGRFAFVSNIEGKWNLILAVTEKGKKKGHRILLDRVFSPEPVPYPLAEMQVEITGEPDVRMVEEMPADTVASPEEDFDLFMDAYEDSLRRLGIDEKIHRLDEVVIKAKKRSKEREIYEARTKSVAYYDVPAEMDDIQDRNTYIGSDIHELMINMNQHFMRRNWSNEEYLYYKGKLPLFVINYERTYQTEMDYNKYRLLTLESIKSIYITEDLGTICRYADPILSPFDVLDLYGCAVLIETYPEGEIPAKAGKGVRKTWLEGYSTPETFYEPDYSILPKEPDYRRTLYWNPVLLPDSTGHATVRFYNNSRCRRPRITVETLTEEGKIGVLNE